MRAMQKKGSWVFIAALALVMGATASTYYFNGANRGQIIRESQSKDFKQAIDITASVQTVVIDGADVVGVNEAAANGALGTKDVVAAAAVGAVGQAVEGALEHLNISFATQNQSANQVQVKSSSTQWVATVRGDELWLKPQESGTSGNEIVLPSSIKNLQLKGRIIEIGSLAAAEALEGSVPVITAEGSAQKAEPSLRVSELNISGEYGQVFVRDLAFDRLTIAQECQASQSCADSNIQLNDVGAKSLTVRFKEGGLLIDSQSRIEQASLQLGADVYVNAPMAVIKKAKFGALL